MLQNGKERLLLCLSFLVSLTSCCQWSAMALTQTLSSFLVHQPPWLCVSFTYRWSLWHFAKRTSDSLSSESPVISATEIPHCLSVCLLISLSFCLLLLLMLGTFSFVLHLKARNCTPFSINKVSRAVCASTYHFNMSSNGNTQSVSLQNTIFYPLC